MMDAFKIKERFSKGSAGREANSRWKPGFGSEVHLQLWALGASTG
jgi:hypothetical protein